MEKVAKMIFIEKAPTHQYLSVIWSGAGGGAERPGAETLVERSGPERRPWWSGAGEKIILSGAERSGAGIFNPLQFEKKILHLGTKSSKQ